MSFHKLCLIISFLLLLFCNQILAQKISGKITNERGLPLEFASVILSKDSVTVKSVATDSAGNYTISPVIKSNYTLKASLVGYFALNKSVFVNNDTVVDIRLITDSNRLKNVSVISKKPLIERKIDRLIFNIDGNLNFSGLDAMDVLMKAPLLDVRDDVIKKIGGMSMGVMIDGRYLAHIDPASVANKIRSIPAENILRIEIITNPGSEYDAEGVSGLVNIVLRKNKKLGYTGSVTAAYTRINQDNLLRIGLDFNYNIKNLRTFLNFGTSTGRALTANNVEIFYPSYTWRSQGYRYEYQRPYFTTIGFEYDLSSKSTLGISFNPLFSYPDQEGFYSISVSNPTTHQIDSTITNNSKSNISYQNYSANVHYTRAFDTSIGQLTVDVDWVKNKFGRDIENNNDTYNSLGISIPSSKYKLVSNNADQPELVTINAVMRKSKKKYTLTYGAKLTFINSGQTLYQYQTNFIPPQTQIYTDNQFNANQNIQAVFANYQGRMRKWQFKAGLRGEQTELKWNIQNSSFSGSTNYFKLFPSFDLNYELNNNSSLNFNASRRFSRPNFSILNPTILYASNYRFYKGNPELSPYFTNNIDLSYTYNPLTVGISYSSTQNAISSISDFKSNSNIVVDYSYNYLSYEYYTLYCYFSVEKIKNLQSNFQATTYYSHSSSSLPQTGSEFGRWSGNFRTNNTYSINKKKTLIGGLIFNYQLGDVSGISTEKSRYYFDISLRYSLINRKLDLTFNGRDIFKTNNFYSSSIVNGIMENSFVNDRSRRFSLTVRYNFGNEKIRKGSQYNGVGGDVGIISK
jgi:outer membrane receptor protein involved in Fe transport